MKSLITKTLISVFILFVILSFLILNSNNNKKVFSTEEENNEEKQKTYLYIYDTIVLIFLFLLIIYVFYNGYVKGCIKSLFIWAFFVTCTPVPEAGLLFSLPLKRYLKIPMHISQTLVSFLALGMLYYFFINEKKTIDSYLVGKIFLGLINFKYYSIILISIVSSVLTSELIDNIINNYISKTKISYIYIKIYVIVFFILIYTYLLNSLINKIKKL